MKAVVPSREASIGSPGHFSARGRSGASAGSRRTHRSLSASNHSSTSSDILVAPGPPTTSNQPSLYDSPLPLSPSTMMAKASVGIENRGEGLVVIRAKNEAARALFRKMRDDDVRKAEEGRLLLDDSADVKDEANEDDLDGPNHRGTYSKKYILQHPEIEWIHRGQGRYLPASQSRASNSVRSDSQSKILDSTLQRVIEDWQGKTRSPVVPLRRRSLDDDRKSSIFATPKQRLSLRRQVSEAQTISSSPDQRSARLSRRGKPVSATEIERRSSRFTAHQNYNEDDDEDDMSGDKEPTYDKDYVDAHPGEKFYHTGNGWYKKGDRPKGRKMAKPRESEGHAITRNTDGSWDFDTTKTIHVSQLQNYPGIEFHHCGNGWYKPGRDVTGHRVSRIVGQDRVPGFEDHDVDDYDDDDDEAEIEDDWEDEAVSKEYAQAHPDVEWVHRGNGRYKRKSLVSASATQASQSGTPGAERDQTIYSKEYVIAHPDEEFHHRGNARYMRGPPPDHWASSRRKRSAAANASATAADEDDSQLFSKAYVKQHPNETFHHRGQGRYARGPRPQPIAQDDDDDDEESDLDEEALVDTDYVNSHPEETFHHRGQGRWARGLPPVGASNKVAVRGPGAKDRSDAAKLLEGEDEDDKPPPRTSLVVKAEGPEKWPGLTWHYRGGGKWGRITKQEFEDIQRGTVRRLKGKGRLRNSDGPEAQLEREAAAAEGTRPGRDGGDIDTDGTTTLDKPKVKRRRMNKRGSFQTQEDGLLSKQSSKSQSQAPTPKPRMLEPEEDILTEEDLPQLYRDDWSEDPEDFEDYGPYMPDNLFRPMNPLEKFVKALTKHEPAVRPLDNLKLLAENTQRALDEMQQKYLWLERITAPHARIARKPAKGGRVPIDQQIFEDRKEADLYDYNFDPRRVGYQDPQAQRIVRDADGRELRNRRNRSGAQTNNGTVPGWNFGEDEPLGPRRAVKPVNRFDGIVDQPRRRGRNSANATGRTSKAGSMTPDRVTTPLGGPAPNGYAPATSGRWRGHVPKRILQLRDESVGASKREQSPGSARKGRPPGSKNLHKRRDAGIKKGPRKPKVVDSIETPGASEAEGEGEM